MLGGLEEPHATLAIHHVERERFHLEVVVLGVVDEAQRQRVLLIVAHAEVEEVRARRAAEAFLGLCQQRGHPRTGRLHRRRRFGALGAKRLRPRLPVFGQREEALGFAANLLPQRARFRHQEADLGALGPQPLDFVPHAVLLLCLVFVLLRGAAPRALERLHLGLGQLLVSRLFQRFFRGAQPVPQLGHVKALLFELRHTTERAVLHVGRVDQHVGGRVFVLTRAVERVDGVLLRQLRAKLHQRHLTQQLVVARGGIGQRGARLDKLVPPTLKISGGDELANLRQSLLFHGPVMPYVPSGRRSKSRAGPTDQRAVRRLKSSRRIRTPGRRRTGTKPSLHSQA